MQSDIDVSNVSPALQRYSQDILLGDVWKRPDLNARDRSVATVAALMSRNQTATLDFHIGLALENGVKPGEISEIVTHLAFYAGWGSAMAAVAIIAKVFGRHGVRPDQIPSATPDLLPIEPVAEERRAISVRDNVGSVSPGVVKYTGDLLFHDLWLRPDLVPRDRSLVTVSALIANGQVAQVPFHLNRAMDNGLTQPQASELLTHLAFYVGWPNVMSAVPVFKGVFDGRPA